MKHEHFGFNKTNYKLLFIGLFINIIGFILMIGGGAEQLNEFNSDELFSFRRITLAPLFIMIGYILIVISIMKRPKSKTSNKEQLSAGLLSPEKKSK